jgi:F-type H+-transporting ATPase subunit gamma
MATLKALRRRITTVRSTQKITRAMKMVAAAKLRRAQEAAERARPYSAKLTELFAAVVAEVGQDAHPLLARREEKRVDIVLLTSDRGLCGGYNTNAIRTVEGFLREHTTVEANLVLVGKKGAEYFRRRSVPILDRYIGMPTGGVGEIAEKVAEAATGRFGSQDTDAVYLVYNRFQSAMSQVPTIVPLLPVPLPATEDAGVEYIFEPERPELLARLLPAYVRALVTQAILEAAASEQGARMTAMENATNNAADMISSLTLLMNRTRQAAITRELMEIVSGAEALKG